MSTLPITYGSSDISDTGLAVPRGIPMRIFALADSTGLQVPSSAWAIPAAVPHMQTAAPNGANGHHQSAGPGHNSGNTTPMEVEDGGTKARTIAEIRDWLANRPARPADYMSAAEIGAAENRLILLKRALIDGAAYIRRALDALDPDPERRGTSLVIYVYLYDCLFSDNDEGCSTASNTRYAKLLGVGERAIRYARNLLVELHALVCLRRGGLENCYWPVVNRNLAGDHVHLTWWLDATSDTINRGRRPGKPRHDTDRGLGKENPGTDVQTPAPSVPDSKETPARIAITPARPFDQPIENKENARLEFTKEFTNKDSLSGAGATSKEDAKASSARRTPAKPTSATDAEIKVGFEEWYGLYPKKKAPLDAKKAYASAIKAQGATPAQLLTALRAYKFPGDKQYIPHPATWLNRGSWLELNPSPQKTQDDEFRELVASDSGKKLIATLGKEAGTQRCWEIVIQNRKDGGRD